MVLAAASSPGSIGLVLSGGGARGAYEVGVLSHIARTRPELLQRIRIITGSSVGAVNGAFLASRGLTPESVEALAELWMALKLDDVVGLSSFDALKMLGAAPLRLLHKSVRSPASGLLDGGGLWKLVKRRIDWDGLHRNIQSGRFDAVAVLGTDLASGHTHVFTTTQDPNQTLRSSSDFEYLRVRLARAHVLASAAIPLLFPPIRVRDRWYIDGGVRNNTPFSPALHLGAHSLLIMDVHAKAVEVQLSAKFPGIGRIVGTLLDSIFLDRVGFDLDRLQRINDFLEVAAELGMSDELVGALAARGRPKYRYVPHAVVKPSADIGLIAAECVARTPGRFSFIRVLDALFQDDANSSGDAASFLFFDGGFASELIALGRRDAADADAELARL